MAVTPEPQTITVGSVAWSFLAGLGGAAIPLSVMWIKLQLDQLSARCDAFAKAVEGAMDLALDYWLTGVPEGDEPDADDSEAGKKRDAATVRNEIRLRGTQAALQADVERMVVDLPPKFRSPLRAEFQNLINALTGVPFGDRKGTTEVDKATDVVSSGTRLVRIVREGRDDGSRLGNMLRYVTGISFCSRPPAPILLATFIVYETLPFFIFAATIIAPSGLAFERDRAAVAHRQVASEQSR